MQKMNKFIKSSSDYIAIFSGFLFFIMCILSTYEALSRTIFNAPTKWTITISAFLMIYAVFFSSAYCFLQEGHIRVELLLDKVGEAKRRFLLVVGYLSCALVVAVLCWRGTILTSRSIAGDWLTQTAVQVPIAYVNIAIPLGCILMLLALFVMINEKIRRTEEE